MALKENSTARVYLSDGKGKFSINNASDDINSYLKRESLDFFINPLKF